MMGMMYSRMLDSLLRKNGIDARSLDASKEQAAAEEYRPHVHMERLRQKYFSGDRPLTAEERQAFQQDYADFLQRFGHFSDSGNDFSSVPWREIPELIAQMIERPPAAVAHPEHAVHAGTVRFDELKLPVARRGMVRWFYRRSCRFGIHREAISSLYTYGHGLFRTCFIELGGQLAARGILDSPIDIFYLYLHEVQEIVRDPAALPVQGLIRRRVEDIERMRDIPLPETIFGSEQPPVAEVRTTAWKGIPTSLGAYTGTARILHGLSEFNRLSAGDVLVIPFSDVGWTPLFGKAGAVVAESGGMLSHSSIMAREYRIPAVVSVPNACLIPDGSIVTVNGFTGEIHVQQKDEVVA
jgi:pyruvate,water dikinase